MELRRGGKAQASKGQRRLGLHPPPAGALHPLLGLRSRQPAHLAPPAPMAQAEGVAAAVSSFPKPAYASPASPCMENMLRGQPQRGDMEAWVVCVTNVHQQLSAGRALPPHRLESEGLPPVCCTFDAPVGQMCNKCASTTSAGSGAPAPPQGE